MFSENIPSLVIATFVSSDAQVTKKIFFETIFQKNFLIKFNFGKPDILKIIFVSKLNIIVIKSGNEVSKWIIKKFGFSFFKRFLRGKMPYKITSKDKNLE